MIEVGSLSVVFVAEKTQITSDWEPLRKLSSDKHCKK